VLTLIAHPSLAADTDETVPLPVDDSPLPSGNWLENRVAVDPHPYSETLFGDGVPGAKYYRRKNARWTDRGLSIGGYASANVQWGSLPGATAAVGEFLFLAEWEFARDVNSARRLIMGFAHDQTFGHPTTREFANSQMLIETPNDLDTESSLSFTTLGLLLWEHEIRTGPNRGWGYRLGQLYAPSYFGIATYLDDDRQFFMARPLAAAAGAQWVGNNDIGLGAHIMKWKGPWYLSAGVTDAQSNRHYPDFASFLDGRYLYLVETGIDVDPDGPDAITLRLTGSYLDVRDGVAPAAGPGKSLMFSALKRFDGRWALSGRWSKSFDRLSSEYRELLSLGSLWLSPFGRSSDILGVGVFAGDPADSSAGTERGTEIFYRVQLTQALNIMPDLQYWKRSGKATNPADTWVAGIRVNFDY
jgi:hypothetical protein